MAFLNLEKKLFSSPRLKVVLANSRRGRDEILNLYNLPEDRVRILYNGLDRERYHPGLAEKYRGEVRAELGLAPDEPVVLFVGSGFVRKGLAELIRSLPLVGARLLVAGADRAGPFQDAARRLGVDDRVVFLGPRRDVDRLYGAADAFVLPSWYEPFSNACLEAAASGLPVVVTRESGAAEAIREGANGYLVDFPVDPEELADKVNRALKLDKDRIVRTNETLLAPFSWDDNLEQTLAAYREILENKL